MGIMPGLFHPSPRAYQAILEQGHLQQPENRAQDDYPELIEFYLAIELIDNPVSIAPEFRVGTGFVMAGVPVMMPAMSGKIRSWLHGRSADDVAACADREGFDYI